MKAMIYRALALGMLFSLGLPLLGFGAPVIDPLANTTIPAGRSLILPITATSSSGSPLTYTITSSTNAIAVVMHTNNPFWQLTVAQAAPADAPGAYNTPYRGGLVSVTNVGTMTFMLFPEYAPHTVNVFQGLTESGFYNSNTIFHRVISGFMIQGGDPLTNGTGGLVFQYDDEFNPQAIFSGSGQLALANSGIDTDGSQFFVTIAPYRSGDFDYTLFGQMVRGFPILTNLNQTAVDTNSRPLADEIIQTANYVTNTTDTVLTLTATNVSGIKGVITVIAKDGTGGLATNTFTVTTVTDTNGNGQPFFYPNTSVTNLVAPLNTTLTNFLSALELGGDALYWNPEFVDATSEDGAPNSSLNTSNSIYKALTYNVTNVNGQLQIFIKPATNYAGPVNLDFYVSSSSSASLYWEFGENPPDYDFEPCTFVFGDTAIRGQSNTVSVLAGEPFSNMVLATFTNGVPRSNYTNFTAFINWGDNSTNAGTVTANAAGVKAVLGSHTYIYPGTYPVYVQVQSGVGASATILSTVKVLDPTLAATNSLTTYVTGQGTVSPVYTNTPLVDGDSYSVSATPANLWLLLNWTDNNGFVLGTGANLTFTMSPGLSVTANFALIGVPTVALNATNMITNLYSAPVTLSGTASNNATVTGVWFQANTGGWQEATGTTNWTASFVPNYGVSNVIRAYAINNYGYISPTNTWYLKILPGDVLTLSTNGLGVISPNLNQALLPLGSNYVLTATPASGFTFVKWTGGFSTNKAALSFTMTSNLTLTANFADATPPSIAVTNLVYGQQVTSNAFSIMGLAADNWQVANVSYSLNGAPWTTAITSNNWANWSAPVVLVPGTNSFSAYAVDPNGEGTETNTLYFQYLVTNQLTIRSIGLNTITPNYSNAWLAIGCNYVMSAAPGAGFVFNNWTTSTNWAGGAATNSATVQFMMESNLTLQVKSTETTKPGLTITSPTSGQHMTNALPTVVGTTSDNWGVAGVWYQLNNKGPWTAASTANVWTNWSTTVQLGAGTNTVSAYALNLGGNYSATNTISVVSSNAFLLQLGFLTPTPWTTNGLNLGLLVSTGLTGHIQFSTNLLSWATLTNFAGTNSPIHLLDPAATNSAQRFYRAVIP